MTDAELPRRPLFRDPARRTLLVLLLLVLLGTAALTATGVTYLEQERAATADELATYETRQDTRRLLEAICAQVEAIAQQTQLKVEPCPDLPPVPPPALTGDGP